MSGSAPRCFVRFQDQPGSFETSGGDAQLRQHRARRPSVRRDRPGAVTRAKPHDLGERCGRALARGVDKHRARSK
eukprot:11988717-Karenia_brevis.AAC.1